MTKENGVKVLTDMVADFVAHIGKKLPDDVVNKLEELGSQETAALPKVLYETMTKNQGLAVELNRPSCQDTGVLQFWLKCGTNFPYINELEALLKDAVVQATFAAPLRHNSVETFDEYNTKKNVGKGTPTAEPYPLLEANPYSGRTLSYSSIIRSLVTLATILAAAMDTLFASPLMMGTCGIWISGMVQRRNGRL